MTQLQIGKRALVITLILALATGVGAGLLFGWIVWPVQVTNVDPADLSGSAQENYILLIANTYAYDLDLDQARARLARLNQPKIEDRVAELSKKYAPDDPNSEHLTKLAIALGSAQVKVAQVIATANPALTPAIAPTAAQTPEVTLTVTGTLSITATHAATTRPITRTPTRPRATATPKPPIAQPIGGTNWSPSFPAEWPGGVSLQGASVAPGQKYWHLTQALYCDLRDTRFDCGNKPGGLDGIGVWVTLIGGKAPLILDGKTANLEDKSADAQCQCTYSLDFPGPTIEVASYPSDKIIGLANSSVRIGFPNTHVRYFLTFQLVTR